ncbi:MAG: NAD(P)-dependent oxidoreductase [bacterium]
MQSDQLRLVVLGGTGFIGSALLRQIAALPQGDVQTRVLVRTGKEPFPLPSATVIAGSLPHDIPQSLFPEEPHVVIHLATRQIDSEPENFYFINVYGTKRLLAALSPSTLGLIYSSSTSVYGQGPQEDIRENTPLCPKTELARSRAAAEAAIMSAMAGRGRSAFLLRPRFILGNEDRYTLPGLIRLVKAGIVVGSGLQAFSVIDVDDYARIILILARRILARANSRSPLCAPFHAGYEQPLHFHEIITAICQTLSLPLPRTRIPFRPIIPQLLRLLPFRSSAALATRLELIGQSHFFNVSALSAEIGKEKSEIITRDPLAVLSKALKAYQSRPQP